MTKERFLEILKETSDGKPYLSRGEILDDGGIPIEGRENLVIDGTFDFDKLLAALNEAAK